MKYFCTHSDQNYLAKGLAMYNSVISTMQEDFTMFYLCLDDKTYNTIKALCQRSGYKKLRPIQLNHLFTKKALEKLKSNPRSEYGDEYSQFCWALTPYFTWWLMLYMVPDNDELLYCDADLYFYHSPEHIFNACSNHSVGIHRHRFSNYNPDTNNVGEFNVGCVYFRNNGAGFKVAEFWKCLMQNPNNEYAKKYGTCGDQKYWDLLYPMFRGNICIFDVDDSNIAHGAPWNFSHYKFIQPDRVSFKEREQLLVFNHFSHFNSDGREWRSSNHGEWAPEEQGEEIKKHYQHYFLQHKAAMELISEIERQ